MGTVDPRLSDLVALLHALELRVLELWRADLANVAEHVRGERSVRVGADVDAIDADATELVLVLAQVVDEVVGNVSLQRHRATGDLLVLDVDVALDLRVLHSGDPPKPLELLLSGRRAVRKVDRVDLQGQGGAVSDQRLPRAVGDV